MPVYTYTARDRGGKILTATMEATSQRDVATALRDKGLFVSEIKAPARGMRADIKMPAFLDRVGLRDVTIFSRQFATVINAGERTENGRRCLRGLAQGGCESPGQGRREGHFAGSVVACMELETNRV